MKVKSKPRAPTPPSSEALVAQVERRAREDFEWTCEHLLKIKTEVSGLAPLTLIPTQLYLHRRYAQPAWDEGIPLALVILKSRRARVSTFWEAWFFTRARFYPLQSVLIAAHLDSSVNALYEMVERFHQHLPAELQPPVKRLNRKELAYEGLESAVKVAAARYMDISRGQLINHCHLAEAPYLPDPETVLSGLSESIPRRGRSSLVLEGTANGQGTWFHQFWKDVGRLEGRREFGGRHWQRVFIPWYAHPDYMLPVPKDFELTPEERDRQRRFKLMPEQLVWYRMALQEMEVLHPGRGQDLMSQENAETPEESFLASGSVIFPGSLMASVRDQQRDPIKGFRFERAGLNEDSAPVWRLVPDRLERAPLLVWEEPDAKYQYTLGVDVSSGVGRHESTIVVIRMPGFKQVAEWGDAETTSADLAGLVACVARYYAVSPQNRNGPIVNVDVTGGWGMDTNNRLLSNYTGEPLQLYVWELFDRLVPAPVRASSRTGWLFTYVSKNILIATALNLLKEQLCDLPSVSIQEDLAGLQEEHLNQRSVVEMSGSDRAVAWLLGIVAAWRKIARWSWPTTRGAAVKQDAVEARDRMIESVMYSATHDTTVQDIYQPRGVPAGSTAGDKDTDWKIQW